MIGHPGFIFTPDNSVKGARGTIIDKSEESGDSARMAAASSSEK